VPDPFGVTAVFSARVASLSSLPIPAALLRTELTWIQAETADLRAGRLTWTIEGLRDIAARAGATPQP
jgi:hypothetical protein